MKKMKLKNKVKVLGLVQSGSSNPLIGITFIATQQDGEKNISTFEYAGYALGNLSIRNLYSKSELLHNYIDKLCTDKKNKELVDLMMEENVFRLIRYLPSNERKDFFCECCKVIQAEIMTENHKTKKIHS